MDVHVVAWRESAWAASLMLAEQLRLALGTSPPSPPQAAGRVYTHLVSTDQTSPPSPPQPAGSVTHHRIRRRAGKADQAADVAGVVAAIQAQASPGSLAILDEADFDGRSVSF